MTYSKYAIIDEWLKQIGYHEKAVAIYPEDIPKLEEKLKFVIDDYESEIRKLQGYVQSKNDRISEIIKENDYLVQEIQTLQKQLVEAKNLQQNLSATEYLDS